MYYNRLKIRVLGLFKPEQEFDSLKIREILTREKGPKLTDKAIEMALMRYSRQGLLSRERRGGRFQYSLTKRGAARLQWLSRNMNETKAE
jgi:DNA-binding transcriptional regulator PaaX